MRTEQYYINEISKEVKRIFDLKKNKETALKFWEILKKINPKSCIVKIGWKSGEGISILLAYEKGGNKEPFDLFIENIENKAEIHGFICGLFPEIFVFDTNKVIEDETHYFVDFNFKHNG